MDRFNFDLKLPTQIQSPGNRFVFDLKPTADVQATSQPAKQQTNPIQQNTEQPSFLDETRNFLFDKMPATMGTIAQLQEDPFNWDKVKSGILGIGKNAVETYVKSIANSIDKGAYGLADLYEAVKEKKMPSVIAGKVLNAITGELSAAISPVSSLFSAAEEIPVVGSASKVFGLPFAAGGDVASIAGETALKYSPLSLLLSETAKKNLEEPVKNLSSLLGQIVLGGKVMGETEKTFDYNKISKITDVDIIKNKLEKFGIKDVEADKVIQDLQNANRISDVRNIIENTQDRLIKNQKSSPEKNIQANSEIASNFENSVKNQPAEEVKPISENLSGIKTEQPSLENISAELIKPSVAIEATPADLSNRWDISYSDFQEKVEKPLSGKIEELKTQFDSLKGKRDAEAKALKKDLSNQIDGLKNQLADEENKIQEENINFQLQLVDKAVEMAKGKGLDFGEYTSTNGNMDNMENWSEGWQQFRDELLQRLYERPHIETNWQTPVKDIIGGLIDEYKKSNPEVNVKSIKNEGRGLFKEGDKILITDKNGEEIRTKFIGENENGVIALDPRTSLPTLFKHDGFDIKTEEVKTKIAPELETRLKEIVKTNENNLRKIYSEKPEAQEKLNNIIFEMEASQPGQRVFINNPVGANEVFGVPSTFPKWIPEELRSTALFNKVLEGLKDINNISFPEGKRSKQRKLYNSILSELDKELGIDTNPIREDIISIYDGINEGKITGGDVGRYERGETIRKREQLREEAQREITEEDLNNIFGGEPIKTPETNTGELKVPKIEESQAGGSIKLMSGIDPGLDKFINEDVKPGLQGAGKGVIDFLRGAVNLLSPKTGVDRNVLDRIFEMKGARDKAEAILDLATRKIENSFDKMSQKEQVDFVDRIKRGDKQSKPELQAVADFMRNLEDQTYSEVQKFKPSAVWKENHFRVLWKTIPGAMEGRGFGGIFRRPLQGTRGFLKHATLVDMSEGLNKGGVPYSYNPMTMFKNSYADMMKFITAQRMWQNFKDTGIAKFVKFGEKSPEGFVRLNDNISNVYFPIESGIVRAGEWFIEDNAGRLLNNFLSRDLIRETSLGRGLMAIKNSTTAVELSLSAFHFTFETIEAGSSGMAVGIREMYNLGILKKNGDVFIKGIKDFITSPFAAKTIFMHGRQFLSLIKNGDEFIKSDMGRKFIKEFPDAKQYIDDFFNGGGKLKMARDYEIQMEKTFVQNLKSGNYIGATLRAAPAAIKVMMKPLFDVYIPALKIGMFVKEFPLRLQEMERELALGKISRGELARQTIDFIDNRLGEMNFDNLFWNRTFKTSLQFFFRSITWKLGNVRAFGDAIYGQGKELVEAVREGRAPKLTPEASWLLSLSIYTAVIATITMKLLTGKYPQTIKDYIYPQSDKDDPNKRISLPTYARDAFSLVHSPLGYMKSSMSGEIGRILDVWQNKDFYGTEIYNPSDPFYMKTLYSGLHLAPVPFSISNFMQPQMPTSQKVGGFFGFTKAPAYISQTPIQSDIFTLYDERFSGGTKTKEQIEASKAKSDIRRAYIDGDDIKANVLLTQAVNKGYIKEKGVKIFIRDSDIPGDVRAFSRFDATDQIRLVESMSVEDLSRYAWELKPEVKAKLASISEEALKFVDLVKAGRIKEPKWIRGQKQ